MIDPLAYIPYTAIVSILLLSTLLWILSPRRRLKTSSSSQDTQRPREDGNLLIIDGSNGPLRFDRHPTASCGERSTAIEDESSISFLRVVNGVSKGERMELVSSVQIALQYLSYLESAVIYFDGLGMTNEYRKGKEWEISPYIRVNVTDKKSEVDDVIVRRCIERYSSMDDRKDRLITTTTFACLQDTLLHLKTPTPSNSAETSEECNVYTIVRNEDGGGKSRCLLKPLCLLRRSSVSCLFGSSFSSSLHKQSIKSLEQLSSSARRLFGENKVRALKKSFETIVVTDDIFLRQRIVDAGGIVMTFEQFWILLKKT